MKITFTLQSNIDFEDLGFKTMTPNKRKPRTKAIRNRYFRDWFGTEAFIAELIWKILFKNGWLFTANAVKPVHLLWTLNFMQAYSKERTMSSLFDGADPKTLRK